MCHSCQVLSLDIRVFLWIHERFSAGDWLVLMGVLSAVGGGWGACALAPLLAVPKTRCFAKSLAAVIVTNAVAVFVLKAIVKRRRPYLDLGGVPTLLSGAPTDFSFPSGHAAGSFACATFFAFWFIRRAKRESTTALLRFSHRVLAALVLLAACGVALSRCALGVHYPSDVLAGAALGSLLGAAGARRHLAFSRRVDQPLENGKTPGIAT